jgi:hypothetical protein
MDAHDQNGKPDGDGGGGSRDARPPDHLPSTPGPRLLSLRQRRFVTAYFANGGNATRAAEAAGFPHPNKSGSQLLRRSAVRRAIAARFRQVGMTEAEICARLALHARADIGDVLDIDPNTGAASYNLAKALDRGIIGAVRRVSLDENGRATAIEMYDAGAALATLAKIAGLFKSHIIVEPQRSSDDIRREILEKLGGPASPR